MWRAALMLATSTAVVVGAVPESAGRVVRVACRDGARCDLDKSCDGSCLLKVCPKGGGDYGFCGRRKAEALFPQPVVAGDVSEECGKRTCLRVRCRKARPTCNSPVRPCTLSLGAPFDRRLDCRATLARSTSDTLGLLYLSVRDGEKSAEGIIFLPSPESGVYTVADGVEADLRMHTLPGFASGLHVNRLIAGTDVVADVTVEAEIGPGLNEVRGMLQGVFGYANGTVLVPFAVEF